MWQSPIVSLLFLLQKSFDETCRDQEVYDFKLFVDVQGGQIIRRRLRVGNFLLQNVRKKNFDSNCRHEKSLENISS